ncbi:Retrovirus-related Pol polyprotein from transposon TNT 1-94 [Sesamum alatum]|uniref:Retrovirus-related Pol polyprotein from transposon TNT 1-94 n=1 Tax=Sesamum alatum TaxID=300844 RepID=A0AAE1YRM1_9LAMI|nr:Retrovirus-related Pol polyprotein from transposon TNT 1-94 [Sesamum alatum]
MEDSITHDGDMFKLTAENYSYWKPMMEDHLYCENLHDPIIDETKPEGKDDNEWMLLNRKAVAMIRKFIDHSLFEHVSNYTNAYELWTKLESMIQKKTPCNKAHLVRRLVKLEYRDSQNMIEHLNNFKGLVNKLTKAEMTIDDGLQALLLLSSLPKSWDTLVVTLSNSSPDGQISMDIVCDGLLNEEATRKERRSPGDSKSNVFDTRGRSENRGRNKTRAQSREIPKSRSGLVCYYCGATIHVTPNESFFSSYKAGNFGTVKMGNEDMCQIVGRGDIILSSNLGCQLILKDVRHVPDMCLNLISVGKLKDDGFESHYGNGKWKLTKGNLVVARGIKEGSLIGPLKTKKPEKPKHKIVDLFDPPVTWNETREVDARNDPTISSNDQAEEQNEQAEGGNNPAPVESAEPQLSILPG